MNTPAHVVINLLVLTRRQKHEVDHRVSATIVAGALLPDLAIIFFYAWQLALGTSESQIWSVEYYRPFWQAWIDSFNSIPLIGLAMLVCYKARKHLLFLLFSSMMLHVLLDLPVHNDDGHRHFFPFSDWRFESPVSYWDPDHHGYWFSLAEILTVTAIAGYLAWQSVKLWPWVAATTGIYLAYWMYVFVVWM